MTRCSHVQMVCRNHKEVTCEWAHGNLTAVQMGVINPKKKDLALSC